MNNISHQFLVDEAVVHGIEQAILLSNIRFWLQKNKDNNANCHDGFYWTYNSAKAFSELFPYMSRQSITRYLKQLCDKGILMQSNYNEAGYDRTFWYTIPSEFACNTSNINIAQNEQSIAQNEQSIAQNELTIPDINTDITQISISSLGETKNSEKNLALKWVEYFVNKHGFAFHEAQTAKTVPMFIRWNENNVTVDDVELAILAAHGWLSKKGESKATSPALYDKFLKTVLAEKQQAQKNPLEGNQAGSYLQLTDDGKVISYEHYSTQRKQATRDNSIAAQQAECTRQLLEKHRREQERETRFERSDTFIDALPF